MKENDGKKNRKIQCFRALFEAIEEPSWSHFGPTLGASWAMLEASWDILWQSEGQVGAKMSHIGTTLGPNRAKSRDGDLDI